MRQMGPAHPMKAARAKLRGIHVAVILLAVGYVIIGLYMGLVLDFEFLRSDVWSYWQSSLSWPGLLDHNHVPGYPMTIALLRIVTFGKVPPVVVMMSINLAALLAGTLLVYRTIQAAGVSDDLATLGATLFALWPFVGLVFTVYPLADVPAMALLLGGLLALLRARPRAAAPLFGLASIYHKAMWPFIALILVAEASRQQPYNWRELAILGGILVLPEGALWLLGTFYYASPSWIISSNVAKEISSQSGLPLLDGLIPTIAQGGVKGLVKGGLIVALALLAGILLVAGYRLRPGFFGYGMALSAASLLLFIFLNQRVIWAAVRFGRLLALPLMWNIGHLQAGQRPRWARPSIVGMALLGLLLSQFAFGWYMARVVAG